MFMSDRAASDSHRAHDDDSGSYDPDHPREPGAALTLQEEERAGGFVIAYPFAFLANRYMIARGKGHAVVHQYHH